MADKLTKAMRYQNMKGYIHHRIKVSNQRGTVEIWALMALCYKAPSLHYLEGIVGNV